MCRCWKKRLDKSRTYPVTVTSDMPLQLAKERYPMPHYQNGKDSKNEGQWRPVSDAPREYAPPQNESGEFPREKTSPSYIIFEHSLFDEPGPRVRVCCWWFCVSWFLVGSCFLVFGGDLWFRVFWFWVRVSWLFGGNVWKCQEMRGHVTGWCDDR